MATKRKTTEPGYVNQNGQIVIRNTGERGSHKYGRLYEMKCGSCGATYGVNGCDIHQRKCPNCQGGAADSSPE